MGTREEFEKLTEIRDSLSEHIVFIGNTYTTPSPDFYDLVNWLNGAWYAFQKQQKKIDAIVSIVRDADLSDGNSSVAIVHDEIQELLK